MNDRATNEERLAALEADHRNIKEWMVTLSKDVGDIKAAAQMGRGMVWLVMKIGMWGIAAMAAYDWIRTHIIMAK